ncbi:hypothetical protein CLV98_12311 [Dyadobacter jejuensis]|uniref:Uncharacterized protein n=1 Tax=Dyadobacter jejuensis TaxID=1082580 RepID=A0A316A846_9BACT|nr:hypothetical protein [Dyadobacter jejuensis]PWJ53398.1 hypothetical protein CLV98_12311 [Dyadobacter jejuensis]
MKDIMLRKLDSAGKSLVRSTIQKYMAENSHVSTSVSTSIENMIIDYHNNLTTHKLEMKRAKEEISNLSNTLKDTRILLASLQGKQNNFVDSLKMLKEAINDLCNDE